MPNHSSDDHKIKKVIRTRPTCPDADDDCDDDLLTRASNKESPSSIGDSVTANKKTIRILTNNVQYFRRWKLSRFSRIWKFEMSKTRKFFSAENNTYFETAITVKLFSNKTKHRQSQGSNLKSLSYKYKIMKNHMKNRPKRGMLHGLKY